MFHPWSYMNEVLCAMALYIYIPFQTLPVHPRNGWFLEEMCQGIRFFGRFFPALSPTPGSLIVAGSTLLDANPKVCMYMCIFTCIMIYEYINMYM